MAASSSTRSACRVAAMLVLAGEALAVPRFEANLGQAPPEVRFLVRSSDYTLLLHKDATMQYLLRGGVADADRATALWVELSGANSSPRLDGEGRQEGVTHYLLGADTGRWVRSAPAYGRVRCRDVYPGIDLVFHGGHQALEFDFHIAPGADPARIRLRYRGASKLRLDSAGDLVAEAEGVELRWKRPKAWQEIDGSRREVPVSYSLGADHVVSFRLGTYAPDRPLIIDPVIRYSTYLGGGQFDAAFGVAADASGAAYVVGETWSVQFPAGSSNSAQARMSRDAFVAKLNAGGSALEYLVFLGGAQSDSARAVAVDSAGNAYVAGVTSSWDFPTTAGAWRRTHGGLEDGFAVKLGPGGNLIYSTFVGAGGSDFAVAIAADGAGCAYVAGYTSSLSFPVTSGAYQSSYRGGYYDGFVVKLDAAGSAAVYATLLGGSRNDIVLGIAVDGAGAAWVGGQTDSADFPVVSAAQTQLGGSSDGFVAKLSSAGGTLLVSTYLGGSASDAITAVALDGSGACYVAGWTASGNFPVSSGALQRTYAGSFDAVVVKLAAAGGSPVFATYLGGSASDQATAVRVDGAGNVWVAGFTRSLNFPLRNASGAFRGEEDGFLSVLNAAGASLVYSDLLGGSGQDRVYGMALDAAANAWLTGFTLSADFPTTPGSFRPSPAGAGDGYVAVLATTNPLLYQEDATRRVAAQYFLAGHLTGGGWIYPAGYAGWRVVAVGDFDGNAWPDVLWQSESTSQVTIHYFNGQVWVGWAWLNTAYNVGWHVVALGDFNQDGKWDLVWQHESTRQVVVHFYGGAQGNQFLGWAWLNSSGYPGWRVVGSYDFDGNGTSDLVWQREDGRQVTVHYYRGTSWIGWAWLNAASNSGWRVAGVEDFNGDGRPDLVWQNDTSGQVTVHYCSGTYGTEFVGWAWLNAVGSPGWRALVPRSLRVR